MPPAVGNPPRGALVVGQWLRLLFQRPPRPNPREVGAPGWSARAHGDLSSRFLSQVPRGRQGPAAPSPAIKRHGPELRPHSREGRGVTSTAVHPAASTRPHPERTIQFSAKASHPWDKRRRGGFGGLLGALVCAPLSALRERVSFLQRGADSAGPPAGVRQRLGSWELGRPITSRIRARPQHKARHRQISTQEPAGLTARPGSVPSPRPQASPVTAVS